MFPQPENILVNHNCDFEKGLKLADFGSCRGIYSKQPYTEYISTRWYRAPECLLTDGYYGAEMDMWGVGCVFFEITSLYPLFPGTNELDQINRVHQILGTPPEKVMQKFKQKGAAHLDFNYPSLKPTGIAKLIPHAPPDAVDLMQKLLAYDPDDRISAKDALRHSWFADLVKTEQNLKRRNRGANSRTKMNSSPDVSSKSDSKSGRSSKAEGTSTQRTCVIVIVIVIVVAVAAAAAAAAASAAAASAASAAMFSPPPKADDSYFPLSFLFLHSFSSSFYRQR